MGAVLGLPKWKMLLSQAVSFGLHFACVSLNSSAMLSIA
jgi:hypothetical protein